MAASKNDSAIKVVAAVFAAFSAIFFLCVYGCGSDEGCGPNRREFNGRCICEAGFIEVGGECVPYSNQDGDDDGTTETTDLSEIENDPSETTEGEETVSSSVYVDSRTNLAWMITPHSEYLVFNEAELFCEELILDEYSEWRLPTLAELQSIIAGCDKCKEAGENSCSGCPSKEGPDKGCYQTSRLNPFSSTECGWMWSSTPGPNAANYYEVNFASAGIYSVAMGNTAGARCVQPVK